MATSPLAVSEFVWEITDIAQRFCGLEVRNFSINLETNVQTLVVVDKAESGPATVDKLAELVARLYGCHHKTYALPSADKMRPHVDMHLDAEFIPW
jgi:hypothetical protein